MKPLPFTQFGAEVAFYVVFVLFVAMELVVRLRSLVNREGSREGRASFALLYVAVATGIVGSFVIAANVRGAAIAFARWPIFVLGVAVMASGLVIRAWAIVLLGRFFTNDVRVHPGQTVVDTGPYRWVRHPSYTGLILILIGLGPRARQLGSPGNRGRPTHRCAREPYRCRGAFATGRTRRAIPALRSQPSAASAGRVVSWLATRRPFVRTAALEVPAPQQVCVQGLRGRVQNRERPRFRALRG